MKKYSSSELPKNARIGDRISLHFEDGSYRHWFYAGQLETKFRTGQLANPPELLFVDDALEIQNCRQTRNYHKISSGFCPLLPGIKVVGYDVLGSRAQSLPLRIPPPETDLTRYLKEEKRKLEIMEIKGKARLC